MRSDAASFASPVPAGLDALPGTLPALAAAGRLRRYQKGAILIHEGDEGSTLFIIVSGRLRVYAEGPDGHQITYGVYGPGEYVGEMSLDGGPRSADVVTLEPSQCAVVDRETLMAHLRAYPQFAFELLGKIIRRARAATLSMRQIALNDVYGRLVHILSTMVERRPDGRLVIVERLTHQELANRAGCSREMVSRLMKDLERGGYLVRVGREIEMKRPPPERW